MTKEYNEQKLNNKINSIRPFIYLRPSVSSVTIRFLVLLSLQIIMLFATKSYNAVFVTLSAIIGAVFAAFLNQLIYHEEPFQFMSIITQGIMIGLLLPESYPLFFVFFISFCVLFFSRTIVFKNINAWVNVVAVAVIIAWFVGRKYFPVFTITSDLIPLRNSSVYLIQNGSYPIYEYDSVITGFLNHYIFDLFKVTIPEGFVSMLWDTHSTIPAFRFNLLTIISSIILFSDNSFSGIIPVLFLIIYGILVRLFAPMIFGGFFNQGDIILAFLTSGTLFCVTFLIQWWGTIPISFIGKIVFGIISGILAFLIMGCGTTPIGMVYTVLISNIVGMFIRSIEERINLKTTQRVIAKLIAKGGK